VVRVPGYRFRGPGFHFRRYQIFWEVVGLERGPLNLVGTIEELLERKSSGNGLENLEYGRGDPLRWQSDTLYPQTLALTWPTSGGRSVGIICSQTKDTEFFISLYILPWITSELLHQLQLQFVSACACARERALLVGESINVCYNKTCFEKWRGKSNLECSSTSASQYLIVSIYNSHCVF
jgi:hypothetical protein